jgi:hypothetical protein
MTIDILGKQWVIEELSSDEDEKLSECDGYCDWTTRRIVIEREVKGNLGDMEKYVRKVKRHEIVHAFLCESGLADGALPVDSWADNEEMVDWVARMGERIHKAWGSADALEVGEDD